jgi:hypothetical protein
MPAKNLWFKSPHEQIVFSPVGHKELSAYWGGDFILKGVFLAIFWDFPAMFWDVEYPDS